MKQIIFITLLFASSFIAAPARSESTGNWVGGFSYANASDEDDEIGSELSLGALVGSMAYKIDLESGLYVIPEVRLGIGIIDDAIVVSNSNIKFELNRLLSFSVKGQYELKNGFYIFAMPAYTKSKFTISGSIDGNTRSITLSSSDFGLGIGAGYELDPSTSLEASYDNIDGLDLLSIGLKFNF